MHPILSLIAIPVVQETVQYLINKAKKLLDEPTETAPQEPRKAPVMPSVSEGRKIQDNSRYTQEMSLVAVQAYRDHNSGNLVLGIKQCNTQKELVDLLNDVFQVNKSRTSMLSLCNNKVRLFKPKSPVEFENYASSIGLLRTRYLKSDVEDK